MTPARPDQNRRHPRRVRQESIGWHPKPVQNRTSSISDTAFERFSDVARVSVAKTVFSAGPGACFMSFATNPLNLQTAENGFVQPCAADLIACLQAQELLVDLERKALKIDRAARTFKGLPAAA